MLQPGDRIGRYEIRAAIGEGGFGQVYQAWDPELERQVAIKELSSRRRASDPVQYAEYLERFQLERRVQGQFQHPHIVSVYDMVSQDGDEYLVEELVEGETLRDLIQREERLTPERVVQIGVEMCQAIAAAWERDVVHRDIKPSNILLTQDGHAKLTDFGVAQLGQVSQRTQSDSHHPGTPAYMSPEQEQGYGYLDERSDLYSLGLVLYEALTGRSFKRERVDARQLAPELPRELEKVVMRALESDPADRYQRAAEFEAALRLALDNRRPALLWWGGGAVILLALLRLFAYPLMVRNLSAFIHHLDPRPQVRVLRLYYNRSDKTGDLIDVFLYRDLLNEVCIFHLAGNIGEDRDGIRIPLCKQCTCFHLFAVFYLDLGTVHDGICLALPALFILEGNHTVPVHDHQFVVTAFHHVEVFVPYNT